MASGPRAAGLPAEAREAGERLWGLAGRASTGSGTIRDIFVED